MPTHAIDANSDAEFDALGYRLLGPILDPSDVKALLAEELRFRPEWGYGGADNKTLRVSVRMCARFEPVRHAATRGPHIDTAVALIGPAACLTHVQFIAKLPDDAATHSDIP